MMNVNFKDYFWRAVLAVVGLALAVYAVCGCKATIPIEIPVEADLVGLDVSRSTETETTQTQEQVGPVVTGDNNTTFNLSFASAGRGAAEGVFLLLLLGSLRRSSVATRALDRTWQAIGKGEGYEAGIEGNIRNAGVVVMANKVYGYDAAERFIRKRIKKVKAADERLIRKRIKKVNGD